jgi:Bacterial membrane protein YfhO
MSSSTVSSRFSGSSGSPLAALVVLFVAGCLIYAEFLFFDTLLIATDTTNDQADAFLPNLIFNSTWLQSGTFSPWSYQIGLGGPVLTALDYGIFNPFRILLALCPKHVIPFAIPFISLLKHVACGLLFFFYLRMLRIGPTAAVIGSLTFAYSSYMVLQGQYYHYQNYAIFVVALLLASERWLTSGRWIALVLVVGLLSLKTILHVYELALLLGWYALFRYTYEFGFSWKGYGELLGKLALLYCLGVLLGAFHILPNLELHLESARGSEAVASAAQGSVLAGVFHVSSPWDLLTFFLRWFAPDMTGTVNHYRGVLNAIEAPNVYIGILSLLVLPQVFVGETRRRRAAYAMLLGAVAAYVFWPWLRLLLVVFVKETYKYSILMVVTLVAIVAAVGLHKVLESGRRNYTLLVETAAASSTFLFLAWALGQGLSPKLPFGASFWTTAALSVVGLSALFVLIPRARNHYGTKQGVTLGQRWYVGLSLVVTALVTIALYKAYMAGGHRVRQIVDVHVWLLALSFICGYVALLWALNRSDNKRFLKTLIVLVVMTEVVLFSRISLHSQRHFLDAFYVTQRIGLFDRGGEAIKALKEKDPGFYRIERFPDFPHWRNLSLAQDFYGTSSYQQFQSPHPLRFFEEMFPSWYRRPDIKGRWIEGCKGNFRLLTLLSVKYYLTSSDLLVPYGFLPFSSVGPLRVLKNSYFLPMGFTYDRYVPYSTFHSLPAETKEEVMLKAFVAPDNSWAASEFAELEDLSEAQKAFKKASLSDAEVLENRFPEYVKLRTRKSGAWIRVALNGLNLKGRVRLGVRIASSQPSVAAVFWKGKDQKFHKERSAQLRIYPGNDEYVIKMKSDGSEISDLSIRMGRRASETFTVQGFRVIGEPNAQGFRQTIQKRAKDTLQIVQFQEDHLKGLIEVDKKKLLFLSIPYSDRWEVEVDGSAVELRKVNLSFIGIPLSPGKHTVEIRYRSPLPRALAISLAALFLTVVIWWRWPIVLPCGRRLFAPLQ